MEGTIFALSSGAPPAGIAIIRVSGSEARTAIVELAGSCPEARSASLRTLRDMSEAVLDRAVVLWFPGPSSATGEDVAEFHLHGGRAVVASVLSALSALPGLREARPGEFTRRAFENGRLDLAEAEGLADLLAAETDAQRRAALAAASGGLSARVEAWRVRVLEISAKIEAELDFSDDIPSPDEMFHVEHRVLTEELELALSEPSAELLKDGFRIVLAGPPNVGKSTLFNALTDSDAAIATPIAGTTRDALQLPIALGGQNAVFVDTAGLRMATDDPIEAIGMARADRAIASADLVLWLGPEGQGPEGAWEIEGRADEDPETKKSPRHRVSAITGDGMAGLKHDLASHIARAMPLPGVAAFNRRQRELIAKAAQALSRPTGGDLLLQAENFREARQAFDSLLGRAATEDMLDTLFDRFCIGK